MKIHEVAGRVTGSGEYVLGHEATGSHACYLVYGVLRAGEAGRELRPGRGHEELVLCMSGELVLSGAATGSGVLRPGEAVHLRGDDVCVVANRSEGDAVYVIAGGHSGAGH